VDIAVCVIYINVVTNACSDRKWDEFGCEGAPGLAAPKYIFELSW